MKKTVNINLAGTFFHIDEDAYAKLQRYLEAIKKSLSDPQGSDEILRDIEARIAELFSEKIENNSQVISVKELDEVIAVMGQPEDYMVDEEIFEDAPTTKKRSTRSSYKQLFRDIDNKFIAGVSSGLGHYLGLDAIWVRLLWILLTIFSSGVFIVIYILFWILVPAAEST
jgi:phage shock protein PspC (stress-responsive transcriptional regulator)